ncbi:uncharacterized protein [Triticum aestivum]|uniref:uncharacterized protein isoform X1 n=1 Tax=Triticum aestivum TaxID=4565 RepID=UPI001D003996|nr:uncharacterized protein LOC123105320 isoform X1 [Triticum aestivum]XP_044383298.1 uncharacterized protein LOC123105320 isoform X1 [Triticum aestivum]XP_044383300.1 uncharacterized protein LOC123105320 isoform X1 [Triticum aestivum]XP_044383301.1 uncharacterized protein LOC123105320 isoform X1 [Triticum aestivum]
METYSEVFQYMSYIGNSSASGTLSRGDFLVKGYIKGTIPTTIAGPGGKELRCTLARRRSRRTRASRPLNSRIPSRRGSPQITCKKGSVRKLRLCFTKDLKVLHISASDSFSSSICKELIGATSLYQGPSPCRGHDSAMLEQCANEPRADVVGWLGWSCSGEPPPTLPVSISPRVSFKLWCWTLRTTKKAVELQSIHV